MSKESRAEPVHLDRRRIHLTVGSLVTHKGKTYRITEILDFQSAIGVESETGKSAMLPVHDLEIVEAGLPSTAPEPDIGEIGDKDWQIAQYRYSVIKPLLERGRGRQDVEARARETGVSPETIYRWLKRFEGSRVLSSLVPRKRGRRPRTFSLSPEVEEIIQNVIESHYLTRQRPTIQSAVRKIRHLCEIRGLRPPCYNAVRARIALIPELERLQKRGDRDKARYRFQPAAGKFPGAEYPLAVVQVDHTQVDLVVVDDRTRLPVGRPWLTLAIDVYSRMVAGYYLSLDPPSSVSAGMCLAQAILPKEEWLILHRIDAEWPVWGFPARVHVDNGPEFRSEDFKRSCAMYGIEIQFRPVKRPHYGAHIERLMGTFMDLVHEIPGTTFSSTKDKGEYDPDRNAVMTLEEFERWIVHLICKIYHERPHRGIGTSPIVKWKQGIFGSKGAPGCGMPAKPADRSTVLLDFLPSFERTIQRTGVHIEGLNYYAEALRPWINHVDPESGEKTRFLFRRDPRDITAIWFRDPATSTYVKIPVADQSLPRMNLWEYRAAREELKRQGITRASTLDLARAHEELARMIEDSSRKTRKARRALQRRREHARKARAAVPAPPEGGMDSNRDKRSSLFGEMDPGSVDPFEEIE